MNAAANKNRLAYAAFVCLACYTHYTSVFVLAAQLVWAFWVHPRARRPLLGYTALAALVFAPWLPSLRGDLDSPTTDILSAFSPLSVDMVRLTLGHWSIGFPYAGSPRSFSDLPGMPALLVLAAGLCIGVFQLLSMGSGAGRWLMGRDRRTVLIFLLALATPVGTMLQSAVGTNVFSTRSLAASLPYLAIAFAALLTAGRRPLWVAAAAACAVGCFAVGAGTMLTTNFGRPDYGKLARLADEHPGSVFIDSVALTPGPFTNLDVEGSTPDGEVFRLFIPEQDTMPFSIYDRKPDPVDVARRATAAADGAAIIIIDTLPASPRAAEFAEMLPGYELTGSEDAPGLFGVQALVYERDDPAS